MPDDYEKKNGLNASSAADASQYSKGKTYTNIEEYLNSVVPVQNVTPQPLKGF
jgi:hypothetical protein